MHASMCTFNLEGLSAPQPPKSVIKLAAAHFKINCILESGKWSFTLSLEIKIIISMHNKIHTSMENAVFLKISKLLSLNIKIHHHLRFEVSLQSP